MSETANHGLLLRLGNSEVGSKNVVFAFGSLHLAPQPFWLKAQMWTVAVTQAFSETSATHLQAWALRCPPFAVVGAAACDRQGHALLWGPRVGKLHLNIRAMDAWRDEHRRGVRV